MRIFLLLLCVTACARVEEHAGSPHALTRDAVRYTVCSGYGCPVKQTVQLLPPEWAYIEDGMWPPARSADEEKHNIRRAIARFEQVTGPLTGTSGDVGETFPAAASRGQMDCLDEATNTATYLQLLDEAGLLRFHTPAGRARRGHMVDAWPHTSALVRENDDGTLWVVDSWFLDNGKPPFILPVEIWTRRWHPPK